MIKLRAYLILLIILPNLGLSQCFFHKSYDRLNRDDGFWGAIEDSDKNFVACGLTSGGNYLGLFVLKTDPCGDTLWTRDFDFAPDGGDGGYSILETYEGNYSIYGTTYDSIEGAADNYHLILNKNGDSTRYIQYDVGYNDNGVHHLQTHDSGFVMVGIRNVSSLDSNMFMFKTDKDGNQEWITYFNGYDYYPNQLILLSDSSYAISGATLNGAGTIADWFLTKVDQNGIISWFQGYDSGNPDDFAHVVETDSGFLLTGGREKIPTSGLIESWIVQTDFVGNQLSDTIWNLPYDIHFIAKTIKTSDGNFLAHGTVRPINTNQYGPDAWLVKFNEQGDTIWTKKYNYLGGKHHTYATDINPTKNGGAILSGFVLEYNAGSDNDFWLLHVDSLGNACEIVDTVVGCSTLDCNYISADFPLSDTIRLTNENDTAFIELMGDCLPTSWNWNFGNIDSVQTTNTYYTTPGLYTLELDVAFDTLCYDTVIKSTVVIWDTLSCDTILADFLLADTLYTFEETTVNLAGPDNTDTWYWNGATSSVQDTSITYNIPGTYNITLSIALDTLCYDTMTKQVVIIDTLDCDTILADFILQDTLWITNLDSISLSGSSNATAWTWSFGNGEVSNEQSTSITFDSAGIYNISLLVALDTLCYDSTMKTITVIDTNTGLTNLTFPLSTLELYPNPNNGQFSIRTEYFSGSTITITNSLGEIVTTDKINSEITIMDLSNEGKGIYLIQILRNRNILYSHKVVVE